MSFEKNIVMLRDKIESKMRSAGDISQYQWTLTKVAGTVVVPVSITEVFKLRNEAIGFVRDWGDQV